MRPRRFNRARRQSQRQAPRRSGLADYGHRRVLAPSLSVFDWDATTAAEPPVMARQTKSLENWLTRQFVYSLQRLAHWTPDGATVPLGTTLGTLCCSTLPRLQRVARTNLRSAFPEYASDEIDRLVRRCFQHLGMTLVEFLRRVDWDGEGIERRVEERGLDRLDRMISIGSCEACLLRTPETGAGVSCPRSVLMRTPSDTWYAEEPPSVSVCHITRTGDEEAGAPCR
jgi:hypothetical protein